MTCGCNKNKGIIRRTRATCMTGACLADCPRNCNEGFKSESIGWERTGLRLFIIVCMLMTAVIIGGVGYLYYN